ncbi:uncharacterized protein B0T15DRAFT_554409, partial [Chaetomium strumarium]
STEHIKSIPSQRLLNSRLVLQTASLASELPSCSSEISANMDVNLVELIGTLEKNEKRLKEITNPLHWVEHNYTGRLGPYVLEFVFEIAMRLEGCLNDLRDALKAKDPFRLKTKLDIVMSKLDHVVAKVNKTDEQVDQVAAKGDKTGEQVALDESDDRLADVQRDVSRIKRSVTDLAAPAVPPGMFDEIRRGFDELKKLADRQNRGQATALKQELEETAKKLHETEAENKALQAKVVALKAKVDNPDFSTPSGTQPVTSSDVAGRERKRKRNNDDEDDGTAGQSDHMQTNLVEVQKKALNRSTEIGHLMRTVLERIVPREDLEYWDPRKVLKTIFKLVSTKTNLLRVLRFMDECQTEDCTA